MLAGNSVTVSEEVAAGQVLREMLMLLAGALAGAAAAFLLAKRRGQRYLYVPEGMEVAPCGYEVVDTAARRVQL